MEALTILEHVCVELIAKRNWPGFRCDSIKVTRREKTGVGAYIYLKDSLDQKLIDGAYGPEPGRIVEMAGLTSGLDFEIAVSSGTLDYLELVTCDIGGWDGLERSWRIA